MALNWKDFAPRGHSDMGETCLVVLAGEMATASCGELGSGGGGSEMLLPLHTGEVFLHPQRFSVWCFENGHR